MELVQRWVWVVKVTGENEAELWDIDEVGEVVAPVACRWSGSHKGPDIQGSKMFKDTANLKFCLQQDIVKSNVNIE